MTTEPKAPQNEETLQVEQPSLTEKASQPSSTPFAPPSIESPEPPSSDQAKEWEARVRQLEGEIEKWRDQALRTAAELENYRRRVQRDLPQQLHQAQADLLRGLLPLLDSLERGLRAAEEAPDLDKLKEGLRLLLRQFHQTLTRLGVEPVLPEVGSLPNPEEHEILSTLPAAEGAQSHTIVEVVEPGYRLRGQLLRPARVIVTE